MSGASADQPACIIAAEYRVDHHRSCYEGGGTSHDCKARIATPVTGLFLYLHRWEVVTSSDYQIVPISRPS